MCQQCNNLSPQGSASVAHSADRLEAKAEHISAFTGGGGSCWVNKRLVSFHLGTLRVGKMGAIFMQATQWDRY